jgi:hypothetical protein
MSSICSPCSSHFFPKLSKLNGTRQNWSLSRVLLCFTDQVQAVSHVTAWYCVSVPTFQPCQFPSNLYPLLGQILRFPEELTSSQPWFWKMLWRIIRACGISTSHRYLGLQQRPNCLVGSMHISIFQKGMVAGRQCVAILKSTRKHGEHLNHPNTLEHF